MLGNNIMDVEDSAGGAHDYDEDEDAFMDNDDDEDHYRARHQHQHRAGAIPTASGNNNGLENTVWNAADVTAGEGTDDQSHARAHAGTGGSSKMRSRPINFNPV